MGLIHDLYTLYSPRERRNIAVYIVGIMLYKFGLESVSDLAAFPVIIVLIHLYSSLVPLQLLPQTDLVL